MATYEETLTSITLVAGENLFVETQFSSRLVGNQYRFVTVTDDETVDLADGVGRIIGVLQNKPQVLGDACTVSVMGVSMVGLAGIVEAGDLIGADANGLGVSGGDLGVALHGGAAGELIPVLLTLT